MYGVDCTVDKGECALYSVFNVIVQIKVYRPQVVLTLYRKHCTAYRVQGTGYRIQDPIIFIKKKHVITGVIAWNRFTWAIVIKNLNSDDAYRASRPKGEGIKLIFDYILAQRLYTICVIS